MSDPKFILDVLGIMAFDHTEDLFWRVDGKHAPVSFYIRCNDVFFWGCADLEDITSDNIEVLRQSYKDSKANGAELFCARVRQMRPQGAWYSYCPREEWPLFHACGPERETGIGNPSKPGAYGHGSYSDKALAPKAEGPAAEHARESNERGDSEP